MIETIDKLYLELANVTKARNERETSARRHALKAHNLIRETNDLNDVRDILLRHIGTIEVILEPDNVLDSLGENEETSLADGS